MANVVAYNPELTITLFDGNKVNVPAKVKEQLYRDVQKLKFIEINGELINTSSIKKISKSKQLNPKKWN